ncbi:hypothetical protein ACJIZ3_003323 [Penstemon smallii]|uniref:Uncharacterized protein n=1 Tax=Penstemon smallii TaxID=265156 RepID=A0ABD3UBZ1_9LAMI
MGKSDVEMEDAEKLPHDSGDRVLGAGVERGGKISSDSAVAVDVSKGENGGEELNELRNDAKDETAVKVELEFEPMNDAGSVGEQINGNNDNEDQITTKIEMEEQAGAKTAETNAKTELVEQNATTNGGITEENSTRNVVEGADRVITVEEEKPSEDLAEKMPNDFGREDGDCAEHVAGEENNMENAVAGNDPWENVQVPDDKVPQSQNAGLDEVPLGGDEKVENATTINDNKAFKDELKEQVKEIVLASPLTNGNHNNVEAASRHQGDNSSLLDMVEPATPNSLVRYAPSRAGDLSGQTVKTFFTQATSPLTGESDDGTTEEQAAFMKELENFHREKALDFKPPKFYGQPLNCLKLWTAVIRLGGYDKVTGAKMWRQVGESFHPPKTCTTVSWTFRIFYEKALLEYERHKTQSGELQLPVASLSEASSVDHEGNGYQGSGAGRARRDAASRAMQGWHGQRLFGYGEVTEPVTKDKNLNNMPKREKNLKSISSLKQKRPNEAEKSIKAARTETSKQLVTTVVDVGPPADWVKINVRQTQEGFEVFALVPGLLREEVRVQSDPAGRLVITGQPEQVDNPWGITPFKKIVSLPERIDPLQTSAVVSLHGRLFVRVPFEQSNV